jgi:cytochrome c
MPRLIILIAALILAGCGARAEPTGDAARGKVLMTTYGCGTCHETPGVAGAHGMVGPPLTHMARRTIIAGLLPNTAPNMIHWLRAPQSVVPGNAMPNMAMSEKDGRDLAAFLATLR